MAEFLYLYRGGQRGTTAEESEQIMQKWMNWFKELTATGNLKDGGQPLEAEGKVVRDKRGTVTDGPFAEAKDLVGGYTLVEAESLARAAELAQGCPILESPRRRRSPSRHENGYVGCKAATISSAARRDAWSPRSRAFSVCKILSSQKTSYRTPSAAL